MYNDPIFQSLPILDQYPFVFLQTLVFRYFCIAPQAFQLIKGARIGMEDMYDCVEVVHTYPECVSRTFYMAWVKPYTILQIFFYPVGNSLDLGGGSTFTDYKKVGRPVQEPQV